jgi:tetratricopeptide (TPR) repeat protein
LGERDKDHLLLGISYIVLSSACFLRQKIDTAYELIIKAIDTLVFSNDKRALGSALARQALFSFWKLDFDKAINQSKQTLELSETLDPDELWVQSNLFNAMHLMGMSHYAQGDLRNALFQAERCYKELFPKLITYHKLQTIEALAYTHLQLSNYTDCERYIEEGLETASIIGYKHIEETLLAIRARAMVIQGRFDQAYQDAMKAVALAETDQRDHVIVKAHCILGDIFFTLNNTTQALQHYRIAQIREGFQPATMDGIENLISLSRILIWMNEPEEAKNSINKALVITEEKGMKTLYTRALIVAGYCELFFDNYPLAEDIFTRAHDNAVHLGLPYEIISCQTGMTWLAIRKHDDRSAENHLKEILEKGKQLNLVRLNLVNCVQLGKQLINNNPFLFDMIQANFFATLKILEKNTQTEPLRQDFQNAKRQWMKELGLP